MITATGSNGTVSFDGTFIIIRRSSNIGTFLNQGVQGDRYILARAVTAIEFRDPPGTQRGFIAFDFPGKNPPRGGVFDAMADENAVVFARDVRGEFISLLEAIRSALRIGWMPSLPTTTTPEPPAHPRPTPPSAPPAAAPPAPAVALAAWLNGPWYEGKAAWRTLEGAAKINGWDVDRLVGEFVFRNQENGHQIQAFSVNDAVAQLLKFYAR